MASFARVHRNLARAGDDQSSAFRATVEIGAFFAQQTSLRQILYRVQHKFPFRRIIAPDKFKQRVQIQ